MEMCRLIAVSLLTLALASPLSAQSTSTFEADIVSILNAHCFQCHGGVHQRGKLDLRTFEALMKGGNAGPAVVAGKPDESPLWKKIAKDEMPKTDNKVSAANKKIIREWIENGARGGVTKPALQVARSGSKPADVAARIDAEIDAKLKSAKMPASARATDAEFLRRVYLDITGKPPVADKTREFLADADPKKREKLVDALLASSEFGDHFAERWNNVFKQMSVNDQDWESRAFKKWLAEGLNGSKGWDAIVREMFVALGKIGDQPTVTFYGYNCDMQGKFEPKIMVSNMAQVFLGTQLQCAECHDHPFTHHSQADFWGLAAFFTMTNAGGNPREVKENLPKTPPKAGTPVAITIPKGEARNAGSRIQAKFPGGETPTLEHTASPRPIFAEWLTRKDNRLFAQASVNRLWAHFFGRGFVNPLNDFGDHNAPSHPALLDFLAEECVASNFDVKHMIRSICLSNAYQRTTRSVAGNENSDADPFFARMTSKVLPPEELYDALCIALEVPEIPVPGEVAKKPNPKAPPPPSLRDRFVKFFRGPGELDEPTELKLGVPHVLRLMNQIEFNGGGKLVDRVMASAKSPEEVIDGLFIAVLARPASQAEKDRFLAFVASQSSPREAYDRIVWTLINSSAFVLNH